MALQDFMKKNRWNFLAIFLSIVIILVFSWIFSTLGGHIDYTDPNAVSKYSRLPLAISSLPYYTLHTVMRMNIAIIISLILSLLIGVMMSKSERAANICLPLIDILQSIPVLGFLTITTSGFLFLFPNSLWGAQLAVIFALITSQIWNMILCVYQALKNIPQDLLEMTRIYRLSPGQVFWQLEVPLVARSLIWNTMVSMSASWFMIAASETIVINMAAGFSIDMNMPGIGTVIREANLLQNYQFIFMALLAMLCVIIFYDNFIFKPLLAYCDSFTSNDYIEPVIVKFLKRWKILYWLKEFVINSFILRFIGSMVYKVLERFYNLGITCWKFLRKIPKLFYFTCFMVFIVVFIYFSIRSLTIIDFKKLPEIFRLSFITAARVFFVILVSSIICVPLALFLGRREKLVSIVQPIIQVLAAIPINILNGIFAYIVIRYKLNFNFFCIFIMFLGSQWYTLFNVISGTSMIPIELKDFIKQAKISGLPLWQKFLLPAILPHYITGIIATSGAAWNMSVVSEYLKWGNEQVLEAKGIGSYLAKFYGQQAEVTMGVIVLCIIIGITNRFFWQKILTHIDNRFRVD